MVTVMELSQIQVKEMMSREVLIFLENDTLATVFRIFQRAQISGAPVVGVNGTFLGVLTKTDLTSPEFVEALQQNPDLDLLTVRDFLSLAPLIAVYQNASLLEVTQIMTHYHIHRVFVMSKPGTIVGVVTTYDVVKQITLMGFSTPLPQLEAPKDAGRLSSVGCN